MRCVSAENGPLNTLYSQSLVHHVSARCADLLATRIDILPFSLLPRYTFRASFCNRFEFVLYPHRRRHWSALSSTNRESYRLQFSQRPKYRDERQSDAAVGHNSMQGC